MHINPDLLILSYFHTLQYYIFPSFCDCYDLCKSEESLSFRFLDDTASYSGDQQNRACGDKLAQALPNPHLDISIRFLWHLAAPKMCGGRSPKTGRLRRNLLNRLQKRSFKRVAAPVTIQIRLTPKMCGLQSAFCNILPAENGAAKEIPR